MASTPGLLLQEPLEVLILNIAQTRCLYGSNVLVRMWIKKIFTCYIMLGQVHPKAVNTKQKAATVPPQALKPTRRVIFVWRWMPMNVAQTKKPNKSPKVCGARKKSMDNGPISVYLFIISTMMFLP